MDVIIKLRRPHPRQDAFIKSTAKRKIIRAGRRSGKTLGVAILAVQEFLAGRRVLYATPTEDQIASFWFEVKHALINPVDDGIFKKNETIHVIELENTKQRLRAKTAFNAETLRGDYADLLILDEFQLMREDTWEEVGAPMLLDNNGDAVFIYTPPSLRTIWRSRARDPRYAAKLFKKAEADESGRWQAFHFSSLDNPHISRVALDEIAQDMTRLAYQQEILALDIEDNPAALWKRADIEGGRVATVPELHHIVVGVDPTASTGGDEAGIVSVGAASIGDVDHFYVLKDSSLQGSPATWAGAAVADYGMLQANEIIAEKNQGGEMVEATIHTVDPNAPVKLVHASRGKATRAEPVVAMYEQGRVHHVGQFPYLEDEMCQWATGAPSPNRMDALVWAITELMEAGTGVLFARL